MPLPKKEDALTTNFMNQKIKRMKTDPVKYQS